VIYMGIVKCPSVRDYWAGTTQQIPMDLMGFNQFLQIQKYIHILLLSPVSPPAWYMKLEPMATMLVNSFRLAYLLSTNCSINEMMVQFAGRSIHKVKMPSKPIDEGYKIFAICDHGYTCGFEVYSREDGA